MTLNDMRKKLAEKRNAIELQFAIKNNKRQYKKHDGIHAYDAMFSSGIGVRNNSQYERQKGITKSDEQKTEAYETAMRVYQATIAAGLPAIMPTPPDLDGMYYEWGKFEKAMKKIDDPTVSKRDKEIIMFGIYTIPAGTKLLAGEADHTGAILAADTITVAEEVTSHFSSGQEFNEASLYEQLEELENDLGTHITDPVELAMMEAERDDYATQLLTTPSGNVDQFYNDVSDEFTRIGSEVNDPDRIAYDPNAIGPPRANSHIYAAQINGMRRAVNTGLDNAIENIRRALGNLGDSEPALREYLDQMGQSGSANSIIENLNLGEYKYSEQEQILDATGAPVLDINGDPMFRNVTRDPENDAVKLLYALSQSESIARGFANNNPESNFQRAVDFIYETNLTNVLTEIKNVAENNITELLAGNITPQQYNSDILRAMYNHRANAVIYSHAAEKIQHDGILASTEGTDVENAVQHAAIQAQLAVVGEGAVERPLHKKGEWQNKSLGGKFTGDLTFNEIMGMAKDDITKSYNSIYIHERANPLTGDIDHVANKLILRGDNPATHIVDADHMARYGVEVGNKVRSTTNKQSANIEKEKELEEKGKGKKKKKFPARALKEVYGRMKGLLESIYGKIQSVGFGEMLRKAIAERAKNMPGYGIDVLSSDINGQVGELLGGGADADDLGPEPNFDNVRVGPGGELIDHIIAAAPGFLGGIADDEEELDSPDVILPHGAEFHSWETMLAALPERRAELIAERDELLNDDDAIKELMEEFELKTKQEIEDMSPEEFEKFKQDEKETLKVIVEEILTQEEIFKQKERKEKEKTSENPTQKPNMLADDLNVNQSEGEKDLSDFVSRYKGRPEWEFANDMINDLIPTHSNIVQGADNEFIKKMQESFEQKI